MKLVFSLIAAAVALFLIAANFSAVQSRYACSGSMTNTEGKAEVFIQLEEYRFWVGLWSDSKGNLKVEVPNQFANYFAHLEQAGNVYGIFESKGGKLAGNFSTLSRSLNLKITDRQIFEGSCRPR